MEQNAIKYGLIAHHGHHTHILIASVVMCIRPTSNQINQYSFMDEYCTQLAE